MEDVINCAHKIAGCYSFNWPISDTGKLLNQTVIRKDLCRFVLIASSRSSHPVHQNGDP